jgi:hypothetical protein
MESILADYGLVSIKRFLDAVKIERKHFEANTSLSLLAPLKWIALRWQRGLAQVRQSLKIHRQTISTMEKFAPVVFPAVLCIAECISGA